MCLCVRMYETGESTLSDAVLRERERETGGTRHLCLRERGRGDMEINRGSGEKGVWKRWKGGGRRTRLQIPAPTK